MAAAELRQATRAKINWDQVFRTASSIRNPSQTCTSDRAELFGGCNIVYCIAFEDGTRWAFRLPYDAGTSLVEDTVKTMRYVHNAAPDIPIATVHAWSDSEDGDGIGAPYMLLDWIEGNTLNWNTSFPPPDAREKVLAQLARYSVDLIMRTTMQSGSQSALKWMLRRIDGRLMRIFNHELPSFDPIDCLIYRAMAERKYHVPSLDALPFPLMHTDLSTRNFLVDDEFNITGILDWDDWATRLPLQFSMMCPAMISAVDNPPVDFREDRVAFANHFAMAVDSSALPNGIAAHVRSILEDDELQTFHASIGDKGVYAHWVAKYSVRSTQWIKAAVGALDSFVLALPAMAGASQVASVRLRLLEMQEEECSH